MLKTRKEERTQIEMVCLEDLVPKDHILRKKFFIGYSVK